MDTVPQPEPPPAAAPERLAYSVEEATAMLGVHYFSAYRLIQLGKLKLCRALCGGINYHSSHECSVGSANHQAGRGAKVESQNRHLKYAFARILWQQGNGF